LWRCMLRVVLATRRKDTQNGLGSFAGTMARCTSGVRGF
jgi:hypothetical protein